MVDEKMYEEFIKSKVIVDAIFEGCKAYDFTEGKARLYFPEEVIELLFPERWRIAKEKAEKEYKEKKTNV